MAAYCVTKSVIFTFIQEVMKYTRHEEMILAGEGFLSMTNRIGICNLRAGSVFVSLSRSIPEDGNAKRKRK